MFTAFGLVYKIGVWTATLVSRSLRSPFDDGVRSGLSVPG